MYLPLLCHWGWKRRHEWTQDLYFCANNSKKWGPELVKRGPERTQDLYSGRYNEKGRSWVSEKRSRADSGPLFWTLQWKREVLSLWKELLRVSHFLKLLHQKPPLFLHHGEQCAELSTFDIYSYNFLKAINKNCKLCLNCENLLSICGQPAIDAFLNININISINISNINNINKILSLRPHQPEPLQSSLNNMIKSVNDKDRLWSDSGPTC